MKQGIKYARFCTGLSILAGILAFFLWGWRGAIFAAWMHCFSFGAGYFMGKVEMCKVALEQIDQIKAKVEGSKEGFEAASEAAARRKVDEILKRDAVLRGVRFTNRMGDAKFTRPRGDAKFAREKTN